jgi:hypothetical protein
MHSAQRCARWDDAVRVARFGIPFYTWIDMRQMGAMGARMTDGNSVGSRRAQRAPRRDRPV